MMTVNQLFEIQNEIAKTIKAKFPNLTVQEVLNISQEIITRITGILDKS